MEKTKQPMSNPPHPGDVLKELYLEPLNLSVTRTASALGITRKTLSALINRRAGISTEMALRLARAFNTTPQSWLNLQQQYDLAFALENKDLGSVDVLYHQA